MSFSASNLLSLSGFNTLQLARECQDVLPGTSTGQKYHTISGARRAPFLGLDLTCVNGGGATATVRVDGLDYTVNAGVSRTFSNHPYTEINVISATSLDLIIEGVYYSSLQKIKSFDERLAMVWQ